MGNELADIAAKEATGQGDAEFLPWSTPPNMKTITRQRTTELWQQHLNSARTGRWTFQLLGNVVESQQTLDLLRLFGNNRMDHVLLNRLLSGHLPTNSYLHRFKLRDNPACTNCNFPSESIEHLLFFCPVYLCTKFFYNSLFLQPNEQLNFSITDARSIPLIGILKI